MKIRAIISTLVIFSLATSNYLLIGTVQVSYDSDLVPANLTAKRDQTSEGDTLRTAPSASDSKVNTLLLDPALQEAVDTDDHNLRVMRLNTLVSSGQYLEFNTHNLYELLDALTLDYRGNPMQRVPMRAVRLELARRGEKEPFDTIVQTALHGDTFSETRGAINDLARLGTKDAVSVLVALLDDKRPGVSSFDVYNASPRAAAANRLGRMFPDSPLGNNRDDQAKKAFADWWTAHRNE